MEANVIIAKCSKTGGTFGIRIEKTADIWTMTWAFAIAERAAQREGFDQTRIQGRIDIAKEYPGCPHCGNPGFIHCGNCDKICCWSDGRLFTCQWCGSRGEVLACDTFDLAGGGM